MGFSGYSADAGAVATISATLTNASGAAFTNFFIAVLPDCLPPTFYFYSRLFGVLFNPIQIDFHSKSGCARRNQNSALGDGHPRNDNVAFERSAGRSLGQKFAPWAIRHGEHE